MTTDSVATLWLIHRLPAIAEAADLHIHVHTRPAGFTFDPTTDDFAIAYGRPDTLRNGDPLLIADEIITPVCNAALASEIHGPTDLWDMPLLGDRNLHIDWPTFAERTGAVPEPAAKIQPTVTFNHSHLALRAAADGQGVALASSPLANDALDRGELVAPLRQSLRTGNGYYLLFSEIRTTKTAHRIRSAFRQHVSLQARTEAGESASV